MAHKGRRGHIRQQSRFIDMTQFSLELDQMDSERENETGNENVVDSSTIHAANVEGVICTSNNNPMDGNPSIMTGVSAFKSNVTENVSLNFMDFKNDFLTCPLCMNIYDNGQYIPKLLSCSHTLCCECIEGLIRAVKVQSPEQGYSEEASANSGSTVDNDVNVDGGRNTSESSGPTPVTVIKCPVCRETVIVPGGGAKDFPPSFLINRLLDLMNSQRKDIVPRCKKHSSELLMYCETCDVIFCVTCGEKGHGGDNGGSGQNATCIMLPFSVALKRMNEIVLYKGTLCLNKLEKAKETIGMDMKDLDSNVTGCIQDVNSIFENLLTCVKNRRDSVIRKIRDIQNAKHHTLNGQLALVAGECKEIEKICNSESTFLKSNIHQVSRTVNDLNDRLDRSNPLGISRENAFIAFEHNFNDSIPELYEAVKKLGRVRVSNTFPAICDLNLPKEIVVNLTCKATLNTYNFHGKRQKTGNDPVSATVVNLQYPNLLIKTEIVDNENGKYLIKFKPSKGGYHKINTSIFSRNIKNSPFIFSVVSANNPVSKLGFKRKVCHFGKIGQLSSDSVDEKKFLIAGKIEFVQPTCIKINSLGSIYVLDTGASNLKIISPNSKDGKMSKKINIKVVDIKEMENQCATSMDLFSDDEILLTNWKMSKMFTINVFTAAVLNIIEHDELKEPIQVSIRPDKKVFCALDFDSSNVLIFSKDGILLQVVDRTYESLSCPTKSVVDNIFAGQYSLFICTDTIECYNYTKCNKILLTKDGNFTTSHSTIESKFTKNVSNAMGVPQETRHMKGDGDSCSNDNWNKKCRSSVKIKTKIPRLVQYKNITVDCYNNVVTVVQLSGRIFLRIFNQEGQHIFDIDSDSSERIKSAGGIVCDTDGYIHVCDVSENVIKKFRYI